MNERMIELAKQATLKWAEEVPGGVQEMEFFDKEKFAELIVRECCQKLENDGMVEIAIEMKQHFGVEE